MTTIKEEILEELNELKDIGVIDTERYMFLKSKAEKTDDVTTLERLHYLTSYFISFYKEKKSE